MLVLKNFYKHLQMCLKHTTQVFVPCLIHRYHFLEKKLKMVEDQEGNFFAYWLVTLNQACVSDKMIHTLSGMMF